MSNLKIKQNQLFHKIIKHSKKKNIKYTGIYIFLNKLNNKFKYVYYKNYNKFILIKNKGEYPNVFYLKK